jgi:hypothetical protein
MGNTATSDESRLPALLSFEYPLLALPFSLLVVGYLLYMQVLRQLSSEFEEIISSKNSRLRGRAIPAHPRK